MSANFSSPEPQSYSTATPQPLRKGLAIASLVLGLLSIPTLGLLLAGAITGIILGIVALTKIKAAPQVYGGKGMAIAGIVTSALSLGLVAVWGILAAIALPKLQQGLQQGRESTAIQTLQDLHNNQAQYHTQNGKFATLDELASSGLLSQALYDGVTGNVPVNNYLYSISDVSETTFCLHARRASASAANKDFVVCEDGILRFAESNTPQTLPRNSGAPLKK